MLLASGVRANRYVCRLTMVAKTSRTYIAVFMAADILALPGDFVVGKIPRISEGFFLVDLKL